MLSHTKLPGFALGIVKDGELVYAKGFGVTNLDGGAPVTPKPCFSGPRLPWPPQPWPFCNGSSRARSTWMRRSPSYLPYFKLADERYKDITVGQILMHRSGIPDSGDAMADWENFMPQTIRRHRTLGP